MKEAIGFRRNLGLFMAVMIGIGAMMGPEIFAGDQVILVGPATAVKKAKEIFLESI